MAKSFHLSRKAVSSPVRDTGLRFLATILAFLIIVIFFFIVTNLSLGKTISCLFVGAFGNKGTIYFFYVMSFLLILALGLAPCYKLRFWNIGAQGQAIMGCLFGGIVVYYLGANCIITNIFLLYTLALIMAMIGGGLWAAVAGLLKTKLKCNETLSTLMLNYVATQIMKAVIDTWKGQEQRLSPFTFGDSNTRIYFDSLLGNKATIIYIIVAVVAIFMFIYLKFSKHGFEISVVGDSRNTAKYAGINPDKVVLRTVILSGAICALAGFFFLGYNSTISYSGADGGFGFTAIVVAWSSHFNVLAMVILSFLVIFFCTGVDRGIVSEASLDGSAKYVAVGIYLFILIAIEFFLRFKFVLSEEKEKKRVRKKEYFIKKHPKIYEFICKVNKNIDYIDDKIINLNSIVYAWFCKIFKKEETAPAKEIQDNNCKNSNIQDKEEK